MQKKSNSNENVKFLKSKSEGRQFIIPQATSTIRSCTKSPRLNNKFLSLKVKRK